MLTKQNKLDIYGLLCGNFPKNKPIPTKETLSFLEDNGLSYQEFGYKNGLALLKDLKEFLTIGNPQSKSTDESQTYLHDYVLKDLPLPVKAKKNKRMGKSHPEKTKPLPQKKAEEKKNAPSPLPKADKSELGKTILPILRQANYKVGEEYPLATLSKSLADKNISCHKLGYAKMKSVFALLKDYFQIRNVDMKGVSQPWVKILPAFVEKTEDRPVIQKKEKGIPITQKKVTSKKEETKKEGPTPTKGADAIGQEADFYVPDKLLFSIKEMASLGLDNDSIVKLLHDDYRKAVSDHATERRPEGHVFPLSFLNRNGSGLIGAIRKSDAKMKYAYYLSFVGEDKEKPKDYLRMMVHFDDYEESIASLARLARKESWCYHNSRDKDIILKIYLQYTFYRLYSQGKILVDKSSGFVSFNTGLVTPEYDSIYGVMIVNQSEAIKEDYLFQGFTVAGSQGIGKVIVEHFSPLPEKATYVDNPAELFPEKDMQIHTDFHHILLDNVDRIPLSFLSNVTTSFPECKKIVDMIEKEKNDFRIDRLYAFLKEKIEKNDFLYSLLRAALENSIDKGVAMLHDDYRKFLPSFFPTRNVLSFMVPLTFGTNKDKVEAVLLIEKTPSGNYQGQTILTLKQCYVNARLIAPLDNTYLSAEKIED